LIPLETLSLSQKSFVLHCVIDTSVKNVFSFVVLFSNPEPNLKFQSKFETHFEPKMLFDTAGMTSDAMHRMIPRLRPIKLEGMGLVDAVRDLLTQSQQNNPNLRLDLAVSGELSFMDDELELTAYRIVQEAVTNIIRHAQANRAHVTIEIKQGQLHLSIADNGIGAQTLKRDGHYGVRGMQERAESHGGMIEFKPSKEGGLEVQASFPLKQSSQESGKE
jgi:two-component system sensor histidine kinase UhpB